MRMKIYFAAPLFSEAEKEFNIGLTMQLEEAGFAVFLPQRDGVEKEQEPWKSMPSDERRKAMFSLDEEQVCDADTFLFVLDGRVPDEGACVELGIAHANRKLKGSPKHIIGFHTDTRAAFLNSKLNPMIKVPLDFIALHENELLSHLSLIKDTNS